MPWCKTSLASCGLLLDPCDPCCKRPGQREAGGRARRAVLWAGSGSRADVWSEPRSAGGVRVRGMGAGWGDKQMRGVACDARAVRAGMAVESENRRGNFVQEFSGFIFSVIHPFELFADSLFLLWVDSPCSWAI